MTRQRRHNLKRLLAPRHVAFIGGDDAAIAAQQCALAGFAGPIWGVNPRRNELGGHPCFARVEDLPEPPDAVFLAVPRAVAIDIVAALQQSDAGGVVCYTAGFAELGDEGLALEHQLVAAAGDLALVGPNCYGLINYVRSVALWPYGYGGGKVDRGVALVTQSGMLGSDLTMNERSLRFAYVISSGNQAALGIEDFLEVLVDDPAVNAIGLYVEALADGARFSDVALRALEREIPIVVLKAGSSEIGSRLTVSHTGSLSGTDEVYQALFDRLGVVRVRTPVILLETLKLLTISGVPEGRRVAAFGASGGNAAMLADLAEQTGIEFPQPSRRVRRALTQRLPEIATVSNPLDYTTPLWGDEDKLPGVFGNMLEDGYDAALLVQDYPKPELDADRESYLADARSFATAARATGIPAAICSVLPESIDERTRAVMIEAGTAPLQGMEEALIAIAGASIVGERRRQIDSVADRERLRLPVFPMAAGEPELVDEWEAKRRLAAAGVAVPDGRMADAETAPMIAAEIGFPVVAKLLKAELPHKTEAGAVELDLRSRAEVSEAVAAIVRSVAKRYPKIRCDSFLIEAMISDPVAELLVGIRRDPRFGQVMVLASGGTLVELVRDAVTLLLPSDRASCAKALESLVASRLLAGYRGCPAGDREATLEAILSLARFAEAHRGELVELEVNPLMVLTEGVAAVDALMWVVSTRAS